MNTPNFIEYLEPNERIIVGTNLHGVHAGGLAAQAFTLWGLLPGVSEGLCGQCYAFPTLGEDFDQRSLHGLSKSRDRLYATAKANPGLIFLLTKVGTGIAGFSEEEMKPLFKDAPENVIKPKGW